MNACKVATTPQLEPYRLDPPIAEPEPGPQTMAQSSQLVFRYKLLPNGAILPPRQQQPRNSGSRRNSPKRSTSTIIGGSVRRMAEVCNPDNHGTRDVGRTQQGPAPGHLDKLKAGEDEGRLAVCVLEGTRRGRYPVRLAEIA